MKKATIQCLRPLNAQEKAALDTACSNIVFAGKQLHKIVFTGCDTPKDKAVVLMQLASLMAGENKKVLLVDGDLRESSLNQPCGIQLEGKGEGLAHFFAGRCGLEEIIYATDVPGLFLAPAGSQVANPSLILGGDAFAQFLDSCAQQYDYVLINGSAIDPVPDAAEIARYCDGAVLMIEQKNTHLWGLDTVQKYMAQVQCPILGCIVCGVKNAASFLR